MSPFEPPAPVGATTDQLAAELAADTRLGDRSGWTLLGAGGFGAVFLVDRPAVGRREAVKVLWRALDPMTVEAFQREARVIGAIGPHPALITVYDAGVLASGRPFVVTEYAPGGSLADRLAGGPLPWEEAVSTVLHIADGLQRCHDTGVLHLDVKPSNVLLGADGNPRLADFGVARTQLRSGVDTQSGNLHTTGLLASTIAYSPPELLEGRVGVTTDVYMLAATLHALCSGTPPFPRPVKLHDLGLPDSVTSVIERALDPDPGRRPPSIAAFADELRAAVQRGTASRGRRARFAAGAAVLIAAAVAGALWLSSGGAGDDGTAGGRPGPTSTIATEEQSVPTAATTSNSTIAVICDDLLTPGEVVDATSSAAPLDEVGAELRADAVSVKVDRVAVNETITVNGRTVCVDSGGSIIDVEVTTRGWPARQNVPLDDGVELILRTSADAVSLVDRVRFDGQPVQQRLRIAVSDAEAPTLTLRRSGIEESLELRSGAQVQQSVNVLRRDPVAPFLERELFRSGAPIPYASTPDFGDPIRGEATFSIEVVRLAAVTPDGTQQSQTGTAFVWLRGSVDLTFERPGTFLSTGNYDPIAADTITITPAEGPPIVARWFPDPAAINDPGMFGGLWVAEVPWDVESITVTIEPDRAEYDISDSNDLVFSGRTTIEVPVT